MEGDDQVVRRGQVRGDGAVIDVVLRRIQRVVLIDARHVHHGVKGGPPAASKAAAHFSVPARSETWVATLPRAGKPGSHLGQAVGN